MKIALINENSQAAKNELIFNTLKGAVTPLGHEVFNYGSCIQNVDVGVKYNFL